ncbi:nickel-dependent hydrogenase large subunit [Diaphorobacter caeni]|uniref:nickel-dependent hydrogenase large subunit n=1 Tax=Diaphorobacter caeni TaxID=2784387 RepID=UPI00188FEE08|nr:nickel-dependent hydrogenase large subunit [Diaphorobacter caeni]MBF5005653.1 nickel-dependent hydrogenase large subunit [Diaphorobacter caeni]
MFDASMALAGELTVLPGMAMPDNLRSSRPAWASSLAPGSQAAQLPMLLASVFSNCAEAHRICSQWACDAARGTADQPHDFALARLHAETLREHLRRIALDWPARLMPGAEGARIHLQAMKCLREAPVLPGRPLDEWIKGLSSLLPWIEQAWLGMSARAWLSGWERDAHGWLELWSEESDSWLARLMLEARAAADEEICSAPALRVHGCDSELAAFALQLQAGETTGHQPTWRGVSAETGCWTRLGEDAPSMYRTPWLKMGARIAEVAQLALSNRETRHLRGGQITLEKNHGMAWIEMARGVLMHRVELDGERVSRCDVVAPTEWNFHPQGAVARTLETQKTSASDHIIALMTAYDPCVNYRIETRPSRSGALHHA